MTSATPARCARAGAVSANTVFAVALAIVAGLIFAWLFKLVLLDRKPKEIQKDNSVSLAVAATNLYNMTEIQPLHVKTIKVSPEQLKRIVDSNNGLQPLTAAQASGRVTKTPIYAETAIFDRDLEPFTYPPSVSKLLAPGKKPAIIEVPAKAAMVQVNDYVDLHVTMANDAFGAAGNATALIAKGSKVIARFNTTRPGAQPPDRNAPRTYTLEVSPYRHALITLAQSLGAQFSLATTNPPEDVASASSAADAAEPPADLVTPADLAELFGVKPPEPVKPPFTMERYDGLRLTGALSFPGYSPPRVTPISAPAATPAVGAPRTGGVAPAGLTPSNRQSNAAPAPARRSAFNPRTAVVSAAAGNYGFRPVGSNQPGCVGGG